MSNISKVFATYNGQEFECKVGETYEVSDDEDFSSVIKDVLKSIILTNYNDEENKFPFKGEHCGYKFIRPVQKKELSAEELYRICGKKGYELKAYNKKHYKEGIITAWNGLVGASKDDALLNIGNEDFKIVHISHFRKAYSTEEWKPISQIERE